MQLWVLKKNWPRNLQTMFHVVYPPPKWLTSPFKKGFLQLEFWTKLIINTVPPPPPKSRFSQRYKVPLHIHSLKLTKTPLKIFQKEKYRLPSITTMDSGWQLAFRNRELYIYPSLPQICWNCFGKVFQQIFSQIMVVNDGDESHGTQERITLNLNKSTITLKSNIHGSVYIYIYQSDGILSKLSGKCSTPSCHLLLRKFRRETKILKTTSQFWLLVYASVRTSQISGQNIPSLKL